MLIECMVKRASGTPIIFEQVLYNFMPVPFGKHGEPKTSYTEVNIDRHLQWIQRYPRTFREYDPERTRLEMEGDTHKPNLLAGFQIQKFRDSGYIIADYRDKKAPKYAGRDGQWLDSQKSLEAFPTEMSAWEFLKIEVEYMEEAIAVDSSLGPVQIEKTNKDAEIATLTTRLAEMERLVANMMVLNTGVKPQEAKPEVAPDPETFKPEIKVITPSAQDVAKLMEKDKPGKK